METSIAEWDREMERILARAPGANPDKITLMNGRVLRRPSGAMTRSLGVVHSAPRAFDGTPLTPSGEPIAARKAVLDWTSAELLELRKRDPAECDRILKERADARAKTARGGYVIL